MASFTNINNDYALETSLTSFNGFYTNPFRDSLVNGFAFIFVTRPMLFIYPYKPSQMEYKKQMAYNNMTRDSNFIKYLRSESLNEADKRIAEMLSYDETLFGYSSFLPIFTNEFKSFSTADTTLDQSEAFVTKQGFREILPTHKTASEAAAQVSIQIQEDANMTVSKILDLWVSYISNVTDGTFDANPDMVRDGVLDYTSSIYYFLLEPDGRTLKYWSKYTGCWPNTIPYSSFSYVKGDFNPTDININFNYMIKEDMNPQILEDFNKVSLKITTETAEKIGVNGLYSSLKESPLLNIEVLKSGDLNVTNILNSDKRDPLIIYSAGSSLGSNVDRSRDKFELIFDTETYSYKFANGLNSNDYYINTIAYNTVKEEKFSFTDEGGDEWTI